MCFARYYLMYNLIVFRIDIIAGALVYYLSENAIHASSENFTPNEKTLLLFPNIKKLRI